MSAHYTFDPGAIERIEIINKKIGELSALIFTEIHSLNNRPGLIDELIRRCEGLLCELLEIRAASEQGRAVSPEMAPGPHGAALNGNGGAAPI